MAVYSVQTAKHATLVAATVDTVTFTAGGTGLRIRNRGTVGDIYFRFDGTAAVSVADDNYFVGPGESLTVDQKNVPSVSLISAGTPAYSVEVY